MAAVSVTDGVPAVYMIGRSGGYRLPAGTVKRVGTPDNTAVRAEVRAHNQRSSEFVMRAVSDPVSGAYDITGIAPGTYFVVSFDPTGEHSGAIETDIVAVPMD